MTTTTVTYRDEGEDLHPVPKTNPLEGAYYWSQGTVWDWEWTGDLAIAFPFFKVRWDAAYAFGGYDAAAEWAWRSGLITTSHRVMRCGLDNTLTNQCNLQVYRDTTTYTSPIDAVAEVVQMVAPFIAFIPGIGTVVSVALSAAAALALGERIDQAAIDVVAAALPPGPLHEAFRSFASFGANLASGERVDRAALHSTRDLVIAFGGDRGRVAFDAGLAASRGERVSQEALDLARAQIAETSGLEGALAFDTAVGIARNQDAPAVLRQLTRDYVVQAGGETLAALYDAGFALAEGQRLQDAGFKVLMQVAKGNDLAQKALNFGLAIERAIENKEPIKDVLVRDVLRELAPLGGLAQGVQLPAAVSRLLGDGNLLLTLPPVDLAKMLNVKEVVAWAAQACIQTLEDGTHVVDPEILKRLQEPILPTTTALNLASAAQIRVALKPYYAGSAMDRLLVEAVRTAFADPERTGPLLDDVAARAAAGDAEAEEAQEAIERGRRALDRQAYVDYYNGLP